MLRHLRDSVQHPVSLDYFQERLSAGWKLKAIEWEKEVEAPSEASVRPDQAAPYGMEIAPDASHLRHKSQDDPAVELDDEYIMQVGDERVEQFRHEVTSVATGVGFLRRISHHTPARSMIPIQSRSKKP